MLVLLIIFMVAAPLLEKNEIGVDVPEANAKAAQSTQEDLTLTIDKDGKIFLGENKEINYSIENLEEKLKKVFENKEKKILYLEASQGIRYGYIVQVMAACQRAGIEKLAMITIPEKQEK